MFPHSLSYSVLVVEDNHDLNRLFTRQLAFSGHQVIGLESLEAAMLYLDTHPAPDLIIMDLELGDGSGYTLLQYLRQAYFEQTRVIVTSGKPYIPPFLMGLESYKPIDYSLIKPVGPRALSALVEMALRSEPTRAFSTV